MTLTTVDAPASFCPSAVQKTPEEVEAIRKAAEKKKVDKERRKKQQEENVKRKQVRNVQAFCMRHASWVVVGRTVIDALGLLKLDDFRTHALAEQWRVCLDLRSFPLNVSLFRRNGRRISERASTA